MVGEGPWLRGQASAGARTWMRLWVGQTLWDVLPEKGPTGISPGSPLTVCAASAASQALTLPRTLASLSPMREVLL